MEITFPVLFYIEVRFQHAEKSLKSVAELHRRIVLVDCKKKKGEFYLGMNVARWTLEVAAQLRHSAFTASPQYNPHTTPFPTSAKQRLSYPQPALARIVVIHRPTPEDASSFIGST